MDTEFGGYGYTEILVERGYCMISQCDVFKLYTYSGSVSVPSHLAEKLHIFLAALYLADNR